MNKNQKFREVAQCSETGAVCRGLLVLGTHVKNLKRLWPLGDSPRPYVLKRSRLFGKQQPVILALQKRAKRDQVYMQIANEVTSDVVLKLV